MTEAAGDLRGDRSLLAVAGLFAVNGALVGVIGATLPAMRVRLGVDEGGLAVLLVSLAAAAVVSMQIGGRLSDSRGARAVVLPASGLLIAGVALLSLAPTLPLAAAAAALAGLGNGAMDVSMNALGVRVEQARNNPVMSRLHASFSIGNMLAAGAVLLIGGLVGDGARVITPALVTISAGAMAACLFIARWIPSASPAAARASGPATGPTPAEPTPAEPTPAEPTPAEPTPARPTVTKPTATKPGAPPFALVLGAMAFSFGLAEGTAIDWSSVHVTDVALVDPSTGALGLVAVSTFMVLIRLFGDRAVASFGRVAVVRFGGLVAASGYLVTLLGQPLPALLVGWALVGLGVGMIAPQVYAVAGHAGGGRMLAVVVTFGYGAFLVGPAIVGALSKQVGIQQAMIFPLILALVLVALSSVLARTSVDA